jgi:hypothetical protein
MAEVIQLADHLEEVGPGYRFDPDEVLEAAKGAGFQNMVIVGELEDGSLYIAGASNAGECIILMERAKYQLIHGD